MKLNTRKYFISFFMILFCFLFPIQDAAAALEHWSSSWNSITWDPKAGCIHYRIRFFQTWGGLEDGYCGADPIKITQNSTNKPSQIIIDCNDKGELIIKGVNSYRTERSVGGEYEKYVDFDIPVGKEDLNKTIKINMTGVWWRRGGATDDDINKTFEVVTGITYPTIELKEKKYSEYTVGGVTYPCIQIDWERTATHISSLGTISVVDEASSVLDYKAQSNSIVTIEADTSTKGSFILIVNDNKEYDLNKSSKLKISQTYTPCSDVKYVSESSLFTIDAYPQITEFYAKPDMDNLLINLNWSLSNAPVSNFDNSSFILEIKKKNKNGEETKIDSISYKGSVVDYTYQYNLKSEDGEAEYSFLIYRESTHSINAWKKYDKRINLKISSDHHYPEEPYAEMSNDNSSIDIHWTPSGSVWSYGSTMKISRTNLTTSTVYDYVLDSTDYYKGQFTDDLVQMCNEYSYTISMIPGSNKYGKKVFPISETYTPKEIGNVMDLSVSKGAYSNKVELTWNVSSSFDEIAVERREYEDNGSSVFKKIQIVNAITSSNYTIEDKTCLPGILYEYRIYGLTNCAGKIISSKDTIYDYGFRNPTADFYGRITFENGQAVDSVEVRLETENYVESYALSFDGNGKAIIPGSNVLIDNLPVTIQAWVNPSITSTDTMKLIQKSDMYEVGLIEGHVYFKVFGKEIVCDSIINEREYTHISAVYDIYDNIAQIFLNGILSKEVQILEIEEASNTGQIILGQNFVGSIDEVRLWNRILYADEISKDYSRYLVGNENNLVAYYTFNFVTSDKIFDQSFDGSNYHSNTGFLENVKKVTSDLSLNQLSYKGYTKEDGSYTIRAVPYYGNGTAYSLTPKKGTHQFIPSQEIRFVSENVTSHTVNFTDNSSFNVQGFVTYSGGNYPVEGVMFMIDGTPVMKNNAMVMTDSEGEFSFSVPVGKHEVKAYKLGHVFELDGRICSSDSSDLNYQEDVLSRQLKDKTRVKYIGRVAGGTIQEAYPIGHSLSTNNLANDITVKLTHSRPKYSMYENLTVKEKHFVPNHPVSQKKIQHYNDVDYSEDGVLIHVNDTTGEFVAYVIPELYNIEVSATGHGFINGSGSNIDFSSVVMQDSSISEYKYQDSIDGVLKTFIDTVKYNKMQQFIKRNEPTLSIAQCKGNGTLMSYFGADTLSSSDMFGNTIKVAAYDKDSGSYYFGQPVYVQGEKYNLRADVYEGYKHTNTGVLDIVPVLDATVEFNADFASGEKTIIEQVDSMGVAYAHIQAGEPELTSATSLISSKVSCGDSENPTTISWNSPFNNIVYVTGGHIRGTNFVTAGPDRLLTVLRDPPGSNSYSFLEKGVSFTETTTYTGSVQNEGFEGSNIASGAVARLINGAVTPATASLVSTATISTNTIKVGAVHEESYEGSNTKNNTTTLTNRFQTSDDPLYVGADGDVFIGYSTNIFFGESDLISIVSKEQYYKNPSKFEVIYTDTTNNDYMLAKSVSLNMGQTFGTLFAYPQVYIEQTLIPNMEDLRNKLLLPVGTDTTMLKEKANETGETFYVSYLSSDDPDFGKSNSDTTISSENKKFGTPGNILDGPSYKIIQKDIEKSALKSFFFINNPDTINILNQWIDGWLDKLSENEQEKAYFSDKISADEKIENFSFHAGSPIEYTEEYSTGRTHSSSFNITIGASIENETDVETENFAYFATTFALEEKITTTQGGTFESEVERSHSKGFVLAEEGDDDYISVDVYHEKKWKESSEEYSNPVHGGMVDTTDIEGKDNYSSFIFITRGGATSCPYEKALTTKYYKSGTVIGAATLQLEVPSISVENDFVENVPSGEEAFLNLYLRNNSETSEDQWYDLRMIDSSNPDGAVVTIDGNSMSGFALDYLVPAGETIVKTIAVSKGRVLNYDNLQIVLASKCQADPTSFLDVIADTVSFSVHFIPSCSNVDIIKPTNNWTYNTNCEIENVNGVDKHFMPIEISGFDVNYNDFEHIELQYKPASASDKEWITLAYYYTNDSLTQQSINNGFNALTINPSDGGVISYNFFMDALPDQNYDIRAVSYCNINNELYENPSEIVSGIKDMYNPRLFGSPKPANGVLTIDDDIRIDFNETIAEGMLISDNFEVTGIRNGAVTAHDVAIDLDGENDYLVTEATRNFANKDLTFECWVNFDSLQNATFFSHGDVNKSIEMGMNKDGNVIVKVGDKEFVSEKTAPWEKSSWNHVALVYDNANQMMTAYVNYEALIDGVSVDTYLGNGVVEVGRSVSKQSNYFNGKVDQFRIWNEVRSSSTIQANCNKQLSGNDVNLIAYYEMDEAKGNATEDKARGANLVMKGGGWTLPEGRSASFDGKSYIALNTSSSVIASDMDFTLEFWFNAASGAKEQTILSSGDGVNDQYANIADVFSIGFDSFSKLEFRHNGQQIAVNGNYADNNWHNFTLAVSRSSGIARIYMDGELNTYFDADMIGRFASDIICAGAHYLHTDTEKDSVDQFFTGKIDEIRLWKLYRQQSQIESFYNQKVNGDEMGLAIYYPFEHYIVWQGTPEMQFTLEDKANSNNGEANKNGNVTENSNIPPVKTIGAVSPLLFDWVVNDDALIINLKEQDSRIEKTVVNFTVNKIQDVNGNYIASPITWSAYINRNQLKWMDDVVTINKKENEPYTFEMPIINNGGSVINYNLQNMPSWLSASSESGSVNPLGKKILEFEVDPSLAVGSYDEVVYLSNSNNVTEPLKLNVVVEGDTPDWSVDPSKYEYNMVVFAQVKVDDVFSNDEKDMLAAFYQGECVGVAHMSYDKTIDMWSAMLTVYSKSSSSHQLEYRIWDASNGMMLSATSSEPTNFVNDKVIGKPNTPVVFFNGTVKYQNIQLSKGWNWVSFNLSIREMPELNTYLKGGVWNANSIIKNISSGSANYSLNRASWVMSNSTFKVDNKSMYKIYSDVEQTLSVSGSALDLTSVEIPVNKSWNYISYLPSVSMTLKNALANYDAVEGDLIKSNDGFAMYYGNEWIGSLKSLQPNCGYMLKNTSSTDKTFKYPTASSSLRSNGMTKVNASAYESNMNIVAFAPQKEAGDCIHAMVEDKENEVVEIELNDDYALQFITVSAKNGDNIQFVLVHNGESFVATNQVIYAADDVYGSPKNPIVLNFNINNSKGSLVVYPNPVVDDLNITGVLSQDGDATLELFDVDGNLIYFGNVSIFNNVLNTSINMTSLIPGSYMLRVTQNEEVKVFKIVKK